MKFKRRLLYLLGENFCGGFPGPPNNWTTMDWILTEEYGEGKTHSVKAKFGNDASEIWIAEQYIEPNIHSEKWVFHDKTWVFRRIAFWYLWNWAWSEWFGIRRWLYYKVLKV